jgi:hypothetical protein
MLIQIWAAVFCPVTAFYAGYLASGKAMGGMAAVLGYTLLFTYLASLHQWQRRDYWRSKWAMLRAERTALQEALAAQVRSREAGAGTLDSQLLIDAYRGRLAVLDVSAASALTAGYASEKRAGFMGGQAPRFP